MKRHNFRNFAKLREVQKCVLPSPIGGSTHEAHCEAGSAGGGGVKLQPLRRQVPRLVRGAETPVAPIEHTKAG